MTQIDNPYWEAIQNHPLEDQSYGFSRDTIKWWGLDEGMVNREQAVVRWSWSIPDPKVLDYVKNFVGSRSVIDMGAGTGYWAYLMRQLGVDWNPVDKHPPSEGQNQWHCISEKHRGSYFQKDTTDCHEWVNVLKGTELVLSKAIYKNHILFLSWPPYDDTFGFRCLKQFRGNTLIYIGEGYGGCTGDDQFHSILAQEWTEVASHPLVQWFGLHDYLMIYKRRNNKMSTKTTQMQDEKCRVNGIGHETVIARQRGNRVRRRCVHCGQMGRWEHNNEVDIEDVAGPSEDYDTDNFDDYNVSELRALAKNRGITGYSKMKRDELIKALS